MNSNKIIPKVKLQPLDRITPQKNNYSLEEDINYDSYLKQSSLTCRKESKNTKPKYFYQMKRVCEPIETENKKSEDNQIKEKYKKLHGSKHYHVPLIKNQPIINQNEVEKIHTDNLIRSKCSRLDNSIFQRNIEANDNIRLQYLNKNFQDPNKLVLPFPRGGDMTRDKYYKNREMR